MANLNPVVDSGPFVFVTVEQLPEDVRLFAIIVEAEGTTLILEQEAADRLGLAYSFVAAKVTLGVTSPLDAIGLTAAVSACLAQAGISCNMVAGNFHDHVFVPFGSAGKAERLLKDLARAAMRDVRS
jgi:hypothetical protein